MTTPKPITATQQRALTQLLSLDYNKKRQELHEAARIQVNALNKQAANHFAAQHPEVDEITAEYNRTMRAHRKRLDKLHKKAEDAGLVPVFFRPGGTDLPAAQVVGAKKDTSARNELWNQVNRITNKAHEALEQEYRAAERQILLAVVGDVDALTKLGELSTVEDLVNNAAAAVATQGPDPAF